MNKWIIIFIIVIVLTLLYMSRNKVGNKAVQIAFNRQLTRDFNLSEFLVTSTGLPNIPNEGEIQNLQTLAINVMQPVRNLLGVPVRITSGFRSEDVNTKIGGVYNSQHRTGNAADFKPRGMDIDTAMRMIKNSNIPYDQLIIEDGDGDTNTDGDKWIHVSYSMSPRRQALIAVKNTRTGRMEFAKYV